MQFVNGDVENYSLSCKPRSIFLNLPQPVIKKMNDLLFSMKTVQWK
jgi:hypothetical protein